MSRQFLDLGEYAEHLRLQGNERAGKIQNLAAREEDLQLFDELCEDLRSMHPENKPELDMWRVVEYISDQLTLLDELRDMLHKADLHGDIDDELAGLLKRPEVFDL